MVNAKRGGIVPKRVPWERRWMEPYKEQDCLNGGMTAYSWRERPSGQSRGGSLLDWTTGSNFQISPPPYSARMRRDSK